MGAGSQCARAGTVSRWRSRSHSRGHARTLSRARPGTLRRICLPPTAPLSASLRRRASHIYIRVQQRTVTPVFTSVLLSLLVLTLIPAFTTDW